MHTAGGSVGQGMGDTAAVADDVKALVAGFQLFADLYLHIVELDFHTVQEGVFVGGAGSYLVQGVDHFNDAVQDALGQHQAQIAGGGAERRRDEGLLDAAGGGTAAPDQIAEALHDDTAAQHIAQPGDGFAVAVGILERLREMLGHQKGEVGVLRLLGGILIAVTVDGDDAIGVFVDYRALGIHAEGADLVAVFLGAVDDLAFVKLVGQMGKDRGGQLHTHADVHTVGLCGDLQLLADPLHPFAAAAAHGDDALRAFIGCILADDLIAAFQHLHGLYGSVEEELHLVLQIRIDVFQHHIVDIRAQMANGSVQQVQIVLDAYSLEAGAGGGVQLGTGAAVAQVDLVHIVHQLQRLLLADVFVKRTAKVVGNIIFSVGESARTAETAHDRAALAADAGFDFISVDGAAAFAQSMAGFKYSHLQLRLVLHQLVGGENTAGAGTDNDHIILHR